MTNARPSSMPGATSPRWPAAGFLATLGRPGIVLLIAKLERSARNVALLCRLPEAGVEFVTAKARRYAADMAPVIRSTRAEGATSRAAIAAALTARGVPSPSGRGGWLIRATLNPPSGTNRQQHG